MSGRRDNQDVGSEAATIERVRNSSLVKCSGADNVAGLKRSTEAVGLLLATRVIGRGAFRWPRRSTVRRAGAIGSENAGMSSVERMCESCAPKT
jgi:hypothetical protein